MAACPLCGLSYKNLCQLAIEMHLETCQPDSPRGDAALNHNRHENRNTITGNGHSVVIDLTSPPPLQAQGRCAPAQDSDATRQVPGTAQPNPEDGIHPLWMAGGASGSGEFEMSDRPLWERVMARINIVAHQSPPSSDDEESPHDGGRKSSGVPGNSNRDLLQETLLPSRGADPGGSFGGDSRKQASHSESRTCDTDASSHRLNGPDGGKKKKSSSKQSAPPPTALGQMAPKADATGKCRSTAVRESQVPNYESMSQDELRKLVQKYGVKPGSKKYMADLLHTIWESLHSANPPTSTVAAGHDPEPSSQANSRKEEQKQKRVMQQLQRDRRTMVAAVQILREHASMYERILLLECLPLEEVAEALAEEGVRISMRVLSLLLDELGVPYSATTRKRHRDVVSSTQPSP